MQYFDTKLKGILRLDRAEFDAAEQQERVLYVVDETDGFSLYLGKKELFTNGSEIDFTAVLQDISAIKRRLGMMEYVYPDIFGTGEVGSDVAASLREFAADVASGKYSEYKTEQEKWKAYASEHDLNGEIFPDVNCDGEIGADDAAIVDAYAAAAGAGDYANNAEGFRSFMLDRDNAIFGAGISGFRVMTQTQYDRLANPKEDIQYNIIPEVADEAE